MVGVNSLLALHFSDVSVVLFLNLFGAAVRIGREEGQHGTFLKQRRKRVPLFRLERGIQRLYPLIGGCFILGALLAFGFGAFLIGANTLLNPLPGLGFVANDGLLQDREFGLHAGEEHAARSQRFHAVTQRGNLRERGLGIGIKFATNL